VLRCLAKRDAVQNRRKQRIAIAYCEGLAGRRRAGVHDQGARAAIGFGIGAHALEPDEATLEVEILARRPSELDDIEPVLRISITRLMVAQRGAEHLELAFVPAANEVQPEASLADVVSGNEFFGGDQRRD